MCVWRETEIERERDRKGGEIREEIEQDKEIKRKKGKERKSS